MRDEETAGVGYTERLQRLEGAWFKRVATPVNPYRWNIRRIAKGRVLDVGCGIGRNLRYLKREGSVGVDHNYASVEFVKNLGYQAITVEEYETKKESLSSSFNTILISHVLEHLSRDEASALVNYYLTSLSDGGRVVAICPQQKGYASDTTHKTFFTIEDLEDLLRKIGLNKTRSFSFPLPRIFGRLFIYNENIVVFSKS